MYLRHLLMAESASAVANFAFPGHGGGGREAGYTRQQAQHVQGSQNWFHDLISLYTNLSGLLATSRISIQHEGIERIARAYQHVLMPIQRVGFGCVRYYAAEISVPQRFPIRGIVGDDIARDIAREE